ncbi:histidine phosphatase family protein [Yaniella flava]|uniref:Histidine phosphatase family protein n=1 Tax=Yaniella flava TaxID=287930 RepID=A0ABN2U669_9MICC|nr:histidine phosphatase family protein [Micrococcaceae bacterium]
MTTTWNIDIPPADDQPVLRLVLVRHGQTSWNAHKLIQGHHGPGLNATGSAQAQAVARQLLERFPTPDAVFSSDLSRCLDTAAPYINQLNVPLERDTRLREIDNGDWSGHHTATIAVEHAETIQRIRHGEDVPRGNGETTGQLRARTRAFTHDLISRAAQHRYREFTAVAFSHGGAIRALFAEAFQLPGGLQLFGPVTNCAISILHVYGSDTAVVAQYNQHPSAYHNHPSQEP